MQPRAHSSTGTAEATFPSVPPAWRTLESQGQWPLSTGPSDPSAEAEEAWQASHAAPGKG
jgi:hypothetical protein